MSFLNYRSSLPFSLNKNQTNITKRRSSCIQNQEQSERVVTLMLGNIKQVLLKTKNINDFLDRTDSGQNESKIDFELFEFNEYLKEMMKMTVLSARPLNQQLAGVFVFRLIKDLNYWRFFFPFVLGIINEVQTTFQNQKTSQKFNIELLYFIAVKKINAEASFLVSRKQKMIKEDLQNKGDCNQNMSNMERMKMLEIQKQRLQRDKLKMISSMNQKIFSLYRGLQVQSLEPIKQYYCDISPQDNIQMSYKEQFKRNKGNRKDIAAFKINYNNHLDKKIRRSAPLHIPKNNSNTQINKVKIEDHHVEHRSTFNPKKDTSQHSGFAVRRLRSQQNSSKNSVSKPKDKNMGSKSRNRLKSRQKPPRGAVTLQPLLARNTKIGQSRQQLKLRL